MEVQGQFQIPVASPRELAPILIEGEAGWALESVWMFGWRNKVYLLPKFEPRTVQLVAHSQRFDGWPDFYVLLTVQHLSVFILVINQLDAQILVFIISLLYTSTCFQHCCAHHQEVKILLYSIWYHHTCRWPSGAQVESGLVQRTDDEHIVLETCRSVR